MVIDICLMSVDKLRLPFQQVSVFYIFQVCELNLNQGVGRYRNHVIETKKAILTTFEEHNMYTRLQIFMIFFWGLHRNEIPITSHHKNNSNIGATGTLVALYTSVRSVQKANVPILYSINS